MSIKNEVPGIKISLMNKVDDLKLTIIEQFLADDRPWVATYSGGKDSSMVLQLTVEMLMDFKAKGIKTKEVFVVTSDTGVEMPIAEAYLHNKLKQIDTFSKVNGLNLTVKLLTPELDDDFFVCILGKGYPSPTRLFRFCTERLKIKPATKFLNGLVEKHNSIIMLLGVRTDESIARAESINKRVVNSRELSIHGTVANAYCYSPIKDLTTQEVWTYLSNNNSTAPWGSHKDMMKLYDNGSGEADCNIALNPQSASCSKTRFGCWTCTVINKDSSMEGMIKNEEFSWMKPLNDFRNKLQIDRDDGDLRRVKNKNGMNCKGAFLLSHRKELFEELLATEKKVNQEMKNTTESGLLLSDEQIIAINEAHKADGDYGDSVLIIANKYGRNFEVNTDINPTLLKVAEETKINPAFFNEVFKLNLKHRHSLRRMGLADAQQELIKQYAQGIAHEDR